MNIALVILHANPARGGAERYTYDLAGQLARLGHRVSLLSSTFGDLPPGVIQVHLPAGGLTRLGQYRRFLASLKAHLSANSYDVVHAMLPVPKCDLYHPHAGIAAAAVSGQGGPPRAWLAQQFNRLNPKRRYFAQVERKLLAGPRPPVVICLSGYIRRSVLDHYPHFPAERLPTLLNGVDLARFDPAAPSDDMAAPASSPALTQRPGTAALPGHTTALIIAQDFQRKGLGQTIQALARVNDPRLSLVVVGKPDPSAYRQLAKSLGVADRVVFAGATTTPQLYYRAADFFVLPTRHDPCSLVVLEALAMGLPVISTAQNGACEAMTDGRHGFILPDAGDVPRLATAMAAMLDPQRLQGMRQACLDLRPRLSQAFHVQRMVEVYEQARRHVGT